MKSIYTFIAVPALLSAPGATWFAQSARRTVTHIPFDPVAGRQTPPAGRRRAGQAAINAQE